MLRVVVVGIVSMVAVHAAWAVSVGPTGPISLTVGRAERLLVIAPHPDDETLGTGGLIQRVIEQGGSVQILLLTAGDGYAEAVQRETGHRHPPPDEFVAYGRKRLREVRAAVRELAGDKARLLLLGFPDGALDDLLHPPGWDGDPERSPTTGATDPPYDEAIVPHVPYEGDDLRRELARLVHEARPTMVALPDPFDRHEDHRAAGIFALLAVADWVARLPKGASRPQILSYLVHWPDWPRGWDAPVPLPAETPLDLPPGFHPGCRPAKLILDDAEIGAKRAALRRHETQQRIMRGLLAAFERRNEPFCILPDTELRRAQQLVQHPVSTKSTIRAR